jgi:D-proline reductase (dithiol) PrdB
MEPIRYVDRLNDYYRSQGFPPYQWVVNEQAPLARLRKPLAQCRVSMLTSGGVSRRADPPWNPQARNDLRLDEVACDAPSDDFQIHDAYVAARLWSGFMGRIYKRRAVIEEAAPALAKELEKDRVDLFVLVPA